MSFDLNKINCDYRPGLMADTGIIRWPMNFPPSSNAAILREARVGRITCMEVGVICLKAAFDSTRPFVSQGVPHLLEDDGLLVPHWIDSVVVLGGFSL